MQRTRVYKGATVHGRLWHLTQAPNVTRQPALHSKNPPLHQPSSLENCLFLHSWTTLHQLPIDCEQQLIFLIICVRPSQQ